MTPADLRTEILTDPTGRGYAPLWAVGDDTGLAALLNAPGAGAVNRKDVPRAQLVLGLTPTGGLIELYEGVKDLTNKVRASVCKAATLILDDPLGTLNYAGESERALVAMLGPGTQQQPLLGVLTADQLAALQAVCVKQGSRAEVLWGDGSRVTPNDVAEARKVGG